MTLKNDKCNRNFNTDHNLKGGDWNIVIKNKSQSSISKFIDVYELEDVWRIKYGNEKDILGDKVLPETVVV